MSNLVECHSEIEYAQRPVALRWQEQRLEVEEILGEWRIPDGKRFRVRTSNQQVFELSYSETQDQWQIQQP